MDEIYQEMNNSDSFSLLHVARDIRKISGGVPKVVNQLLKAKLKNINSVALATIGECDKKNISIINESRIFQYWGWSLNQSEEIKKIISNNDIIHIHGVWSSVQFFSAKIASNLKIPFVLSAHGMLEPWLWNNQGYKTYLKKYIYWHFIAKNKLNKANIIHAITDMEFKNLKELFPHNKIVKIPNAIDLSVYESKKNRIDYKKDILFMGRIEPKKGLHILLEAFYKSNFKSDWHLKIAGPVWDKKYMQSIKNFIKKNNLSNQITFLGPVFDQEKLHLLQNSWFMVTPSFSDAVGLVNLEAAANYLPSITTYNTGLADWEEGGGYLIDCNVESLKNKMLIASQWSIKEREDRGIESYNHVKRCYSWEYVTPLWSKLYKDLYNDR